MSLPAFRVRPYAHPKYRFVVRAKIGGKWKRRYFTSEAEAGAFATQQNHPPADVPPSGNGASEDSTSSLELVHPDKPAARSQNGLVEIISPEYRGPRIERYFGDHWSMHLPFAYDLMGEFRPRVFVELGVWKGESYFTFCQSALENNVAVRCYGVDSWRGDVHMGKLDVTLRGEVEKYNQIYADFSELKGKTFEEAVGDFEDESIDLLHIDGAHTYEDVQRDFKSWLPKLSPIGVVLFHDIAVRGRGFGVWKLWQEIATGDNSLVFEFGHGLGVWKRTKVSEHDCPFLRRLFLATDEERHLINRHYATAASALALWESREAAELSLRAANEQVETTRAEFEGLKQEVSQLQAALEESQARANQIEGLKQEVTQLQHALKESRSRAEQVSTELEAAQALEREQSARMKLDAERLKSRETEILNLRGTIAGLRKETQRLAAQVQSERSQGAQYLRNLAEQEKTAAGALEKARKALEESRANARRLLASLKIWRSRTQGARAYESRLERRLKNLSDDLFQTGLALRKGDEALPAIFDLISEDIDRINRPPFWWKAMKSLGLLRLAPPGAPRTGADRRAIAAELKAGLKEIRKALSCETIAPEDAALDIRRLFDLRQRANAIFSSLRFSHTISRTSPPWTFLSWTRRRAAANPQKHALAVLFDASWYLGEYPDVAATGIDPLTHYLKWGIQEDRNPNALFDTAWYLARNPDVAAEGANPLEHYLTCGAREGRDPHPLFSTSWYLKQNSDVAAAGINPLQHYCGDGISEGRNPHPLFDTAYYLTQAPEAEGANPVAHYLKGASDVSPHPLFDAKWYLEQNRDVATEAIAPLLHYLEIGWREGRDPHPLFDTSWYLDCNQDVRENGLNPLVHYVGAGGEEGRDPHPLFDASWYRTRNAQVCPPGSNPLTHYLTEGVRQDLDPHPLFDTSWYLQENSDVAAYGMNPLVHFRITGGVEGRDPHPLFDSSWYLDRNPDVRQGGMDPLTHYLSVGARQGCDPHPLFQGSYYEEQRRAHQFSPIELSTAPKAASVSRTGRQAKGDKGVVYAFTSICLNYVPKAIVLARTLKKRNPQVHFCVLINDRVPEGVLKDVDAFDEVVTIEDLNIPEKLSWIFRHSVVELCTAVKGFFMVDLLERTDCKAAFYFDPDIVCFAGLNVLTDKLKQASILLTPHLTDPEATTEAIWDNEICALKHGVYNLGFLGLRPSPEGCRFARWWRDRLRDFCRADIPGGLFTDQRWVDLAPALFHEVEIVRHPGCNAATWNLTNRNIEGDFSTGFTVNGMPLVFYHFSGFDSGAQGAMLDKYGGEMPAAQLLRKWYIQETTKSGEAHFSHFPWTLASFSNGEPISDAHRIHYRDRIDLQKAFPNPFDASRLGNSYYHWYQSEVLGRPIEHDGTGYNPLIEFIEAKTPLQPNPFFDCNWYLQRNPDVAAADMNPLIHFVLSGADEGRQPNRAFYPAYYREQLPPGERSENPLTHYVLRGLSEDRRTDPRYHPIADAPVRNRIRRWAKSGPPLILLVSHYGGGGTEKHLRDLVDCVKDGANFIQLTPGHDGFVHLFVRDDDLASKLIFDPAQQFDALIGVLQECEPQRIHIHHILGNEEYLAALVHELKRPFDFTIHDYYVLAPSPHLVGRDARFVGDDLEAHEDELLAASIAPRRPSTIAGWQNAHGWLIADADRVIAPSRDVARRFSRFFPGLKPIVAAHPENSKASREIAFPSLTANCPLRVTLLGDFLRHKGRDIVLECAKISRAQGHKITFELIGDPHNDARLLVEAGIWVSGHYEEHDVHALLKRRQPHLIWYPALCPETYSYTLSIGLETGLPLVVTDLGSLPERVAGRPWAWVCPWQLRSAGWIDFFLRIRENNFIPKKAPKAPAGPNPPKSSFYYADYLAALADNRTQRDRQPTRSPRLAVSRST
jgi:predicted  nucleic acid-binding Zn-ribbon protein